MDLGVRHSDRPAQYILAVECDGAAYHSALWARERDRLRQEVLEGLGWRFHRIWSTDWFHRREREISRLKDALAEAKAIADGRFEVDGANDVGVDDEGQLDATEQMISLEHLALKARPYVKAELSANSNLEPHDAPVGLLIDIVTKVVDIEGPLHTEEIARRISAAFGKNRTGSRIVAAADLAIANAVKRNADLRLHDGFLFTMLQQENPPVRDRSTVSGTLLKAELLPPMEVTAAAALILRESGGMEREELIRSVANLLGYQRVGPDLARSIGDVLEATVNFG